MSDKSFSIPQAEWTQVSGRKGLINWVLLQQQLNFIVKILQINITVY